MKVKNIQGFKKSQLNLKIKLSVFWYFAIKLYKREITITQFIKLLKRLLIFLSKVQHNKFVNIDGKSRIDLYVPSFPSKAFYTSCEKFMTFDQKLPCTTTLISITSACKYSCKHCYQKFDKGKDVDINILLNVVNKLQNMGIAFFNIEGGEPFLVYDRLKKVCEAIDNRSEIWINTTGYGIDIKMLKELKDLNVTGLMFSLHSHDKDEFNNFMGSATAWDVMKKSIELCHDVGIAVALNSCLGKKAFYDGTFEKFMDVAKEFKVSIIQLIKPKPAGGWLENNPEKFTDEDVECVKEKVNLYNSHKKFKEYPSISAQIIEESSEVFGCTAGGTDRFYINAKGDLQPCEFLNISFGNILSDDFDVIYSNMRKCFEKPADCMVCEKYSAQILKLYKENGLNSLPLDKELSKEVYSNWDRGDETDLYKRM